MFETYTEIGVDNIESMDLVSGGLAFIVVGVGGTAIGIVFGIITPFILRFTDHVRVVEPLIVLIMGYMSYITAEMFHLSGIMA